MSIFDRFPIPTLARRQWRPSADLYRTSDGWLLKVELAGVRPEDVQVQAQGRWLTVSGTRRDIALSSGTRCQSLEIAYDAFERRFEFPADLTEFDARLEFQNGMLLIDLRRSAASDTACDLTATEIGPRRDRA